MPTEAIVSKGEFAQMIGVTNGRVSQMIAAGQIGQDALEGTGQRAKIRVNTAKAHLRRRLDIGQRMGNGLGTRLSDNDGEAAPVAAESFAAPRARDRSDLFEDAIRAERLRNMRFANRRAEEEELARRGEFTATAEVRVALGKVATDMVTIFEGSLTDFASAIAAKFQISQRDVLHILRAEFRTVRTAAARAAQAGAERLPIVVAPDAPADPEAEGSARAAG